MKKKVIVDKSFEFSLLIIELYKELIKKNEFVLSKQILRCGTSIGANVQEAQAAQSKRDFIAKMAISSKEARETLYWLRLLEASHLVDYNYETLKTEINAIINILTSIVKTAQSNLRNER